MATLGQQQARLEGEMRKLTEQTFEKPPPDYAGFMKAVGRYHGIKDALAHLRALDQEGTQ